MNPEINQCIVLFNVLFVMIYVCYLFKVKAFKMNADPLTHQPLFKAALIIPIISFLLLGAVVWGGHSFQIDSDGFNTFLNISKLPLAILSLSIPFGVIVNNVHRTIQTDKQIKEAEKKNKIDGFYAHRKNTVEVIQNIEFKPLYILGQEHNIEIRNGYSSYKTFFPFATPSNTDYTPSPLFITKSNALWLEMATLVEHTNFENTLHYFNHATKIENCMNRMHMAYLLKELGNNRIYGRVFLSEDGQKYEFRTVLRGEDDLKSCLSAYWLTHLSIMEILEHTFTKDFQAKTRTMIDYILSREERFGTWGSGNLINATIPQVVKI